MNTSDQGGIFEPLRYPAPPPASLVPSKKGEGLPPRPGIYFVWHGPLIVYVGLSKQLNRRATSTHPQIREGDTLSYFEFPIDDLVRAEAFYIGVIFPRRNCKQVPWWNFSGW